jgi:hypothetical protein
MGINSSLLITGHVSESRSWPARSRRVETATPSKVLSCDAALTPILKVTALFAQGFNNISLLLLIAMLLQTYCTSDKPFFDTHAICTTNKRKGYTLSTKQTIEKRKQKRCSGVESLAIVAL